MKKIFFILLLPLLSFGGWGQTTLYQGSLNATYPANTAPYIITPNAAWNVITPNAVAMMYTTLQGANPITSTLISSVTGAAAPLKILIQQFLTPPLQPQTINGTVDGQFQFNISSVTSQAGQGFIYVRIVSNTGAVVSNLGTMTTTDLTTTTTNRTLTQLTITNLNILAGQRLLFEIGWNYSTGSATTTTGTVIVRNSRGSADLPVNNVTTSVNVNSWLKFSQTLKFQTTGNIF